MKTLTKRYEDWAKNWVRKHTADGRQLAQDQLEDRINKLEVKILELDNMEDEQEKLERYDVIAHELIAITADVDQAKIGNFEHGMDWGIGIGIWEGLICMCEGFAAGALVGTIVKKIMEAKEQ